MRFRTTAILLAILAVVAAYFFLVENKAHRAQEEKKRTSRKLFQYESKDLDKFVLINPRGERVEVEHLGSQWRIVSPVSAPADEPTISSFIGQVVPGWKSDEVIDAGNAADFGLAKPFATLILLHRGSTVPDTLFVGDKTPTTTTCYVRIGSSGPILISREITHNVMNKGLYHFRDKTFLSFESEGVDGITIHAGARKLDLEKKGTTWWFGDRHVRADRKKVEAYLTSVAKTIIRQFTREDLDSLGLYGLSTPADEITLRHGGETTRIAFGTKTGNEVYAFRQGLDKVVRLEAKLLQAFDWSVDNLRAMNLAFFNPDSVGAVVCETPDSTATFRKIRGAWRASGADTLAAEPRDVPAFLEKLTTVRFEKIVKEPVSGADPSLSRFILRVSLEDTKGAPLDRIVFTRPSKRSEFAASTSANALGSLPTGTIDGLGSPCVRGGAPR